jgi:hypothetical protein
MSEDATNVEQATPRLAAQAAALNCAWPRFGVMLTAFVVFGSAMIVLSRSSEVGTAQRTIGLTLTAVLLLLNAWFAFALFRTSAALGDRRWASFLLAFLCLHPGFALIVFMLQFHKVKRNLKGVGVWFTLRGVPAAALVELRSRWCEHCGYSRRGLGTETPCPECGTPFHEKASDVR